MTEQTKPRSTAQQIDSVNQYLAFGHGRGRIAFEATEYQGKVGYFFIRKMRINGIERECLCFSDGMGMQGDINLLPFFPDFETVKVAKMKSTLAQFKLDQKILQEIRRLGMEIAAPPVF